MRLEIGKWAAYTSHTRWKPDPNPNLKMKHYLLALSLLIWSISMAHAQQTPDNQPDNEEFVYVLRLVERLSVAENWSESDNDAVQAHFKYLQRLTREGVVILAGRTRLLDSSTFGVVIFEAPSHEAAAQLMKADPAVQAQVMTAELFPFAVALMRTAE